MMTQLGADDQPVRWRAWLKAARPLAHGNIAPPILLGAALAFADSHRFDVWMAAFAHAFGILDHLVIVFANDYADRDADRLNTAPTMFSGGSRVLVDGLLRPRSLAIAAIVCALLLLSISALGFFVERPLLPFLALVALLLLHAYSFAPLRLAYRGHGEILQGLGVGFVLPLVGYYAQSGELASAPFAVLAPLVVLGIASNILTALPDAPADRAAHKRSWPVRRGEDRARSDALLLCGGATIACALVMPLAASTRPIMLAPGLLLLLAHRSASTVRFVAFAVAAIVILQLGLSAALFTRS